MNRLALLALLSLTGCAGPASVRVPPPPSITPGALPAVQVRPDAAKPKSYPSTIPVDPWDTSHLQVAHTPGEHKPRTFHEHDLIEVLVRENLSLIHI